MSARISIGMLEARLLERYPAADAEAWDRTGLLVGDPARPVEKVACALDPTVDAIREAGERGANLLVTHHPAFLEPPSSFVRGRGPYESQIVYEAASRGIALMCFHTALDVSRDARGALPALLGLEVSGLLEPLAADPSKGYGHICRLGEPESLEGLAERCRRTFGRPPRVWGRPDRLLSSAALWTGSAGGCEGLCLEQGIELLVCGEIKYHPALAAAGSGLCIIELGHDVSELPFAGVLARACVSAGVPASDAFIIEQDKNWHSLGA